MYFKLQQRTGCGCGFSGEKFFSQCSVPWLRAALFKRLSCSAIACSFCGASIAFLRWVVVTCLLFPEGCNTKKLMVGTAIWKTPLRQKLPLESLELSLRLHVADCALNVPGVPPDSGANPKGSVKVPYPAFVSRRVVK